MNYQTKQFEIFRDIKGYEEMYQISNLGRVKSLRFNKEKIMKQSLQSRGYAQVGLHKNGKTKFYTVHRLVMMTFSPTQNEKLVINHINEDQTDNRLTNLHWCTQAYNCKHNDVNLRRSKTVQQFTKNGFHLTTWDSAKQAEEAFSKVSAVGISQSCNGSIKTHAGYVWKYEEEVESEKLAA